MSYILLHRKQINPEGLTLEGFYELIFFLFKSRTEKAQLRFSVFGDDW